VALDAKILGIAEQLLTKKEARITIPAP